jgi:hypothetical protein
MTGWMTEPRKQTKSIDEFGKTVTKFEGLNETYDIWEYVHDICMCTTSTGSPNIAVSSPSAVTSVTSTSNESNHLVSSGVRGLMASIMTEWFGLRARTVTLFVVQST